MQSSKLVSLSYLTGICAVSSVIIAMVLTASKIGFWYSLHRAFVEYLQVAGVVSGVTIPLGAFLGFLVYWIIKKTSEAGQIPSHRWTKKFLLAWFSIAPALHWYGALFLMLYSNRYLPEFGKAYTGILSVVQLVLFGLSTTIAVFTMRENSYTRRLIMLYIGILFFLWLISLATKKPYEFIHMLPIAAWLPQYIALTVIPIFYGILLLFALLDAKGSTNNKELTDQPVVFLECTTLVLAGLTSLSYFATSQFDSIDTDLKTHGLLMVASIFYALAALMIQISPTVARMITRTIVPSLLFVELGLLLLLHRNDEMDPIVILAVLLLCVFALVILSFILNNQHQKMIHSLIKRNNQEYVG